MRQTQEVTIFWFRRDLRLEDNTGLLKALESERPVQPLFIFDTDIIDELPEDDARISFIYKELGKIQRWLRKRGSSLLVIHGNPVQAWKKVLSGHVVSEVFANRDYEPYATKRDRDVGDLLRSKAIPFHLFKDQVVFEQGEVLKNDGKPYTVYTPYSRKWMEQYRTDPPEFRKEVPDHHYSSSDFPFPTLESIGFKPSRISVPPYDLSVADSYQERRDFPAEKGTSHLSPHLRFGTVSIRKILSELRPSHEIFRGELIWREFFMQILFHFPRVVDHNFKRKYDGVAWRNDESDFEAWSRGETGYPLVDAGMRELNQTGYMHNRVRMVTASFLCKHLLIDWRWGEAYFARKLLDYELSSNNGNWQWSAGTGCDASPYFRIFNPESQLKKFDKKLEYIRKWVPEWESSGYREPMVDHKLARKRALEVYKKGME